MAPKTLSSVVLVVVLLSIVVPGRTSTHHPDDKLYHTGTAGVTSTHSSARLATIDSTQPSDLGRRLLSGHASIHHPDDKADHTRTAGVTDTRSSARLATTDSDLGRRLLSGVTNTRSDRIAQALSASSDAIGAAASGRSGVAAAAQKSGAFARLATRDSTQPSDFGK